MSDLRERIFLSAIQRIFSRRPKIACDMLRGADRASQIFEEREKFRVHFDREPDLWEMFRAFEGWDEAERDCERLTKAGASIIGFNDGLYPGLLREIHDPPPVLTAIGASSDILNRPSVAIVGSRKATAHAREKAAEIAEALARMGFTIVSGMAYGIDAVAHRGAIAGNGSTVAVLGSGVDVVYPPEHDSLAKDISRGGLVVSEFLPGTPPYASNFPQRNRIISGMCLAVVVIEAHERSGSLITARFALEQGRDVMALPGAAGLPSSRGTNRLIRDGAALVECAEEIAEMLLPRLPEGALGEKTGHFKDVMDKDSPLFRAFDRRKTVSVDEIISETGIPAADVLVEITKLVVSGAAQELPGRRYRLRAPDKMVSVASIRDLERDKEDERKARRRS